MNSQLKQETPLITTNLRKGDFVRVIAGKEKGKEGKVLQVMRECNGVLVEQLNLIKKHTKANSKYPKGGIVEREGVLSISNVMILCRKCDKPSRVAMKLLSDGKKIRVCRRCGEVLDI
ncbi:MAG: 50S ribosomal protein L24 [Nitrospirae bacterium]|nr:50S ribosomal protein L24 [Candidatus Troglogloeales bacterium]